MKRFAPQCKFNSAIKTLAVLLPTLFAASSAHALTFCVNDVATLESALSFSTTFAAEPITIKIVQGTYLASTNWNYSFAPPTTIQGGYTAQCASRVVNAANTTIDLQGRQIILAQLAASPQALLEVQGITFTNGGRLVFRAGQDGGDDGSVKLSQLRLSHFSGGTQAAIYLDTYSNTLSLQNVLMDHLSSNSACAVDVVSRDDANVVINHMTADLPIGKDFCFADLGSSTEFFISNSILWNSDGGNSFFSDNSNSQDSLFSFVNSVFRGLNFTGSTPSIQNQINADPRGLDPANGNYRLKATPLSPAINSGEIVVLGGLPATDIEGNPRFVGSRPDRGAYESSVVDFSALSVTNQLDSGAGSLRQAILNANSSPTLPKTITFDIRGANNTPICPAVIALSSNLPALAAPMLINGYSQPGATANTSELAFNANLCVLLKPASGTLGVGLTVPAAAAATTSLNLRGIGFGGFSQPVMLLGGSGHVVAGNQFGGIANGVALPGAGLNAIAIGVNAGGRLIVGGQNLADRNVIGDANSNGINIQSGVQSSVSSGECQVVNNLIGLAANGNTLLPNIVGVNVSGSGCQIRGNRIVGNSLANIWLNNGNDNLVQQNIIGVTVNNTGATSFDPSIGVLVTGSNNRIGAGFGGSVVNGNIIRYMVGGGVVIKDAAAGNDVIANVIYDNGLSNNGMDIDLLPSGGMTGNTPNDVGDNDTGPNQLQNFPVPTFLTYIGQGSSNRPATLSGMLDSKPGVYRIDAYFSRAAHIGGRGHAQVHLGHRTITQISGAPPVNFTMNILVPDQLPNGVLSFTATDTAGNTSEVGSAFSIVVAQPVQDDIFKSGFE